MTSLKTPTYPIDLRALPQRATVAQVQTAARRQGFLVINERLGLALVRLH